jgi:hypothetical protein
VRTSGAASLLARNGAADTSSASDDEEDAVVWAFVAEGEAVEDHTVVAVVQSRAELAAAERGSLTPLGHRFARALNALIEIGPEKGGAS